MSKKFYTDIDLNQNQLLQAVLENLGAHPSTPVSGRIYFNTTDDVPYYYDGNDWQTLGTAVLGLAEGTAINLSETDGVWTISVDVGAIKHSEIDNDELNNPHEVGLTQVLTKDNSAGGNKITTLAPGTDANDAVNKSQLDAASSGLKWKDPAEVATTANINISNPGTNVIDGVTVNIGDRVLVKDQTSIPENGIYIFNGSSSALTRSTDMDEGSGTGTDEFLNASLVVLNGTVNGGIGYTQTEAVSVPGVDDVIWVQFSGAQISGGDGLYRTGTVINVGKTANGGIKVNADDIGVQASEVADSGLAVGSTEHKLKVVTTDVSTTIENGSVAVAGAGILKRHINADVAGNGLDGGNSSDPGAGNGIPLTVKPYSATNAARAKVYVDNNGVAVMIDNATLKHTDGVLYADFTNAGDVNTYHTSTTLVANTAKTITHSLGNKFVTVSVYNTDEEVIVDVSLIDTNTIQITSTAGFTADVVVVG